jgi:hypothetical protein
MNSNNQTKTAIEFAYEKTLKVDRQLKAVLEASNVDLDEHNSVLCICKLLEILELAESKKITVRENGTSTDHYIFFSTDKLQVLMDDCDYF